MPHKYIINIMNLEVYARIKDFDNYAVSNFGNVINIKTGRKLKPDNVKGYLRVNLSGKRMLVHCIVANAFLDKIDNKNIVDHIDNCKSNNRLDNLRYCNLIENCRNAKLSSRNSSGIKGVCNDVSNNKWKASIYFNGKHKHIGHYNTLEEAKVARQNKARELFGEFLNDCEK